MIVKRNRKIKSEYLPFEEAVTDSWAGGLEIAERPLDRFPMWLANLGIILVAVLVAGRLAYLNLIQGKFYSDKAAQNLSREEKIPGPRGIIVDRNGGILADNRPVFSLVLETKEFERHRDLQQKTLDLLESSGLDRYEILSEVLDSIDLQSVEPIVLIPELSQEDLVKYKAQNLPTLSVSQRYERKYPKGAVASSIIGYTGLPNSSDLKNNSGILTQSLIGRAGVEKYYDKDLHGIPGVELTLQDAQGKILETKNVSQPTVGQELKLSIDGNLQTYVYESMRKALANLGRIAGAAIVADPRNGQILSLVSFPTYDGNVFGDPKEIEKRKALLSDESHPLLDRVVSGQYNPGSTIKPLVGLAALVEKVINPSRSIFSPGYLDVPNPYNPDKPSRFLDWRYQGEVNLADALAQSSNVYFYTVGGGFGDIKGLGITRLIDWWQKFGLGKITGVDLPNESEGFLPSPDWKQARTGEPWRLGDTYHVAIGQGDLLLTPIQLISYVNAIANGGTVYQPHLKLDLPPVVNGNLSNYKSEIEDVKYGMRRTVISPMGTAYKLADLTFPVWAKTGSAQIQNNTKENAFFVGFASKDVKTQPEVSILVLIENSKEGSLNAVPVAKDILAWYYANRMK